MRCLFRRFLAVSACVALTMTGLSADEPIAVVSFAGYDSLRKDMEYLDDATPIAPICTILDKCIAEATGEQTPAELSAQRDALLAAILQATAGKR